MSRELGHATTTVQQVSCSAGSDPHAVPVPAPGDLAHGDGQGCEHGGGEQEGQEQEQEGQEQQRGGQQGEEGPPQGEQAPGLSASAGEHSSPQEQAEARPDVGAAAAAAPAPPPAAPPVSKPRPALGQHHRAPSPKAGTAAARIAAAAQLRQKAAATKAAAGGCAVRVAAPPPPAAHSRAMAAAITAGVRAEAGMGLPVRPSPERRYAAAGAAAGQAATIRGCVAPQAPVHCPCQAQGRGRAAWK